MNYYNFHIGDYRRDTTHLSMLEHGAYRQLLDMYYLNEMPIPKETQVVIRRLSARTQDEVNAVEIVLKEFFNNTKDGWVHKRCEVDIASYQGKADANKTNGKLGGRPKKTQVVIDGLINETQAEPKITLTNNQEPITNNQEPITNNQEPETIKSLDISKIEGLSNITSAEKNSAPSKKGKTLDINWKLPKTWGDWAVSYRPQITPDEIRTIAEDFKDYWLANANHAKSKKLDWEAAWRGWVRRQKLPAKQFKTIAQWREENNKLAGDEFLNGSDFLVNSEIIIEKEIYNA